MKPLLVGEVNSYQSNEEDAMCFAFHPDPPHASGGRLCHDIMQLTERDYLRRFDRTDLCWPRWSIVAARKKALVLLNERGPDDVIVLFGAKVARAFDVPFTAFEAVRLADTKYPLLVVLPHPSGINRMWGREGAFERAREVLKEAGVL